MNYLLCNLSSIQFIDNIVKLWCLFKRNILNFLIVGFLLCLAYFYAFTITIECVHLFSFAVSKMNYIFPSWYSFWCEISLALFLVSSVGVSSIF